MNVSDNKPLIPDTVSTDGSEDSWTFLDEVEQCSEVETILLADAVRAISSEVDSENVSETEPEPAVVEEEEEEESAVGKR